MTNQEPVLAAGEATLSAAERRPLRRMAIRMSIRIALAVIAVLGAYVLMPTEEGDWWAAIPMTILGLAVYGLLFVRQLRQVAKSDFPVIRAIEALVVIVLLFLVLFAAIAVQLEAQAANSYSEPLNKIDGLYFAVTTLATVGYGDITPVTGTARVVGIIQMLGNLAILGVAVKLVGRAMQRSQAAKRGTLGE